MIREVDIVIPEFEGLEYKGRRYWSDVEIEQIKRYYGKVDIAVLAKKLDRTVIATYLKAYNLGLSIRPK